MNKPNKKTAIIIPYNTHEEITIECVEKIRSTTRRGDVHLILAHAFVDDRETMLLDVDSTVRFPNVSYCETINNAFTAVPMDCEFLFIMGNDSFPLTPKWLPVLKRLLREKELKVLSPDYTRGGKGRIIKEDDELWYHDMLPSIHYFMRTETFEELGLFNKSFVGACYYSDDYFCDLVNKKFGSGKIARCKNVLFEHRLSIEGGVLYDIGSQMNINQQIYNSLLLKLHSSH